MLPLVALGLTECFVFIISPIVFNSSAVKFFSVIGVLCSSAKDSKYIRLFEGIELRSAIAPYPLMPAPTTMLVTFFNASSTKLDDLSPSSGEPSARYTASIILRASPPLAINTGWV